MSVHKRYYHMLNRNKRHPTSQGAFQNWGALADSRMLLANYCKAKIRLEICIFRTKKPYFCPIYGRFRSLSDFANSILKSNASGLRPAPSSSPPASGEAFQLNIVMNLPKYDLYHI